MKRKSRGEMMVERTKMQDDSSKTTVSHPRSEMNDAMKASKPSNQKLTKTFDQTKKIIGKSLETSKLTNSSSSSSSSQQSLMAKSADFNTELEVDRVLSQNRVIEDEASINSNITTSESEGSLSDVNHLQSSVLINLFRSVDITIETLKSRDQHATFTAVEQGVRSLLVNDFTLHDIPILLFIYPGVYKLDWLLLPLTGLMTMKESLDYQLVMAIANDPITTHSRRLNEFIRRLDQIVANTSQVNLNDYISSCVNNISFISTCIPLKPLSNLSSHSLDAINPNANDQGRLDNHYQGKLLVRELEARKKLKKETRYKELQRFQNDTIEGLRDLTVFRQQRQRFETLANKEVSDLMSQKHEYSALKRLASLIRNAAVTQHKVNFSMDEFISSEITSDISSNTAMNVSKISSKSTAAVESMTGQGSSSSMRILCTSDVHRYRVMRLSELAPTFIRVHRPTRVVRIETFEICLQIPLQNVLSVINSKIAEIDQLLLHHRDSTNQSTQS